MKTVVSIHPTYESAKKKFNEMVFFLGDEIKSSRHMEIELGDTSYKFLSQDNAEKCRGLKLSRVLIDERCILDEQVVSFLTSRIRK